MALPQSYTAFGEQERGNFVQINTIWRDITTPLPEGNHEYYDEALALVQKLQDAHKLDRLLKDHLDDRAKETAKHRRENYGPYDGLEHLEPDVDSE